MDLNATWIGLRPGPAWYRVVLFYPDGVRVYPDGVRVYPDNVCVYPDGARVTQFLAPRPLSATKVGEAQPARERLTSSCYTPSNRTVGRRSLASEVN